jgi:hypothetical protein
MSDESIAGGGEQAGGATAPIEHAEQATPNPSTLVRWLDPLPEGDEEP